MPDQKDNITEAETPATKAGASEQDAEPNETVTEALEDGNEETTAQIPDAEEAVDDTLASLIAELAEAKKQADAAQDQALRAQAELQNFRRRKERESYERILHANTRLLIELLPVLDDFELAFGNIPDDISAEDAAWVDGFQLILRKLQTVLEREDVTAIDATGAFDPNWHEAISVEPSEEVASGDIIAEVRRGYQIHDRVLRPSSVRVAQ
jgi:molecular chaperone GrpE